MDLASARSFRRFSASIVAALLRANSANLACLATSSFASLSNFASRLYCQQTIITNTVYLPFLQRQAAVAVIAPRARKRTQILESCFYLFNSRIGARGGVKIFGSSRFSTRPRQSVCPRRIAPVDHGRVASRMRRRLDIGAELRPDNRIANARSRRVVLRCYKPASKRERDDRCAD